MSRYIVTFRTFSDPVGSTLVLVLCWWDDVVHWALTQNCNNLTNIMCEILTRFRPDQYFMYLWTRGDTEAHLPVTINTVLSAGLLFWTPAVWTVLNLSCVMLCGYCDAVTVATAAQQLLSPMVYCRAGSRSRDRHPSSVSDTGRVFK